jgi:hypothetical protein
MNRRPTWIVGSGRGLRTTQVEDRRGVRVGGLERLRVLEDVAHHARHLRVYADEHTGASAWELENEDSRFVLALSPEVWRGFSGEGQLLETLANKNRTSALPRVRAALKWDWIVDMQQLAREVKLSIDQVRSALAVLGSRGLVGFDVAEGAFFHRELPFDYSQVEKLQPRLKAARRLIEDQAVRVVAQSAERTEVFVSSGGVEHRVRFTADAARCTCPWYAKHQGERGACKHVLAAMLLLEDAEQED